MATKNEQPAQGADDAGAQAGETKAQTFSRVAGRRTQAVLEAIRRLEAVTNKSNYDYTDEQAKKILEHIEQATETLAKRFAGEVKGKTVFAI